MIKLCATSALDNGFPVRVEISGFPPLAVYRHGREFFVTDDTCTHGAASLCDGYQDGELIECPFHGGKFNFKTGEAVEYPCTEALKIYPTVILEGFVYIDS